MIRPYILACQLTKRVSDSTDTTSRHNDQMLLACQLTKRYRQHNSFEDAMTDMSVPCNNEMIMHVVLPSVSAAHRDSDGTYTMELVLCFRAVPD